ITQVKDSFEEEWLAESIIVHPKFDKGVLFNNDLGLLKIKRKEGRGIIFGDRVQPICLTGKNFNYQSGLKCTVAGWGTRSSDSGYSRILQSTLLPILPDSDCRADHVYGPTRISSGMFCAGYMEGGIDTCQGDSGGPLVCLLEGRYTAVGITSWGHGCARANKPGVYTKLSYYLDWIYNVTTHAIQD
ncbi:UNVERIFIED_CONTAM: hypothetical protein GTU68_009818, partial [Idotea baltica]|nr:hypothetical protein [Idotea baltica]